MAWNKFSGLLAEDQPLASAQRAELFDAFAERLKFEGEVDAAFMTRAKDTDLEHEWVRWKPTGGSHETRLLRSAAGTNSTTSIGGSWGFVFLNTERERSLENNGADVLDVGVSFIQNRINSGNDVSFAVSLLSSKMRWNYLRIAVPYHQWVRALGERTDPQEVDFIGGFQKSASGSTWAAAKTNFLAASESAFNGISPRIVSERGSINYTISGELSKINLDSTKVVAEFTSVDIAVNPSGSTTKTTNLTVSHGATSVTNVMEAGSSNKVFTFEGVNIESTVEIFCKWAAYDAGVDLDDLEPIDVDDTEQAVVSLTTPVAAGNGRRRIGLRPAWDFPYDPDDFTP